MKGKQMQIEMGDKNQAIARFGNFLDEIVDTQNLCEQMQAFVQMALPVEFRSPVRFQIIIRPFLEFFQGSWLGG